MPEYFRGLELSRAFYAEAVAPLIGDVPHAAAFLGWGSDVIGFDTVRSTDHGWGPRLQVFVSAEDTGPLQELIAAELPAEFQGWPTHFGWDARPYKHHVEVATLAEWFRGRLGFDATDGVPLQAWLTTPQQRLLEVTAGAVFHDGLGELTEAREVLAWYPDEVWLWLLGCQWRRVAQEEHFVGRTAEVGDELGSRLLAGRLVRDLMRLSFLLERRYAPYGKWLGSGFAELDAYSELARPLAEVLTADTYEQREAALVSAVEALALRHNALGVTSPADPSVRQFKSRPFLVLDSDRFANACFERVTEPWLKSLPPVGGIDQFADSTDVLSYPERFAALADVYTSWAEG